MGSEINKQESFKLTNSFQNQANEIIKKKDQEDKHLLDVEIAAPIEKDTADLSSKIVNETVQAEKEAAMGAALEGTKLSGVDSLLAKIDGLITKQPEGIDAIKQDKEPPVGWINPGTQTPINGDKNKFNFNEDIFLDKYIVDSEIKDIEDKIVLPGDGLNTKVDQLNFLNKKEEATKLGFKFTDKTVTTPYNVKFDLPSDYKEAITLLTSLIEEYKASLNNNNNNNNNTATTTKNTAGKSIQDLLATLVDVFKNLLDKAETFVNQIVSEAGKNSNAGSTNSNTGTNGTGNTSNNNTTNNYSLLGDWVSNVPTHMFKDSSPVSCSVSAQIKNKDGDLIVDGVTYKLIKTPGTSILRDFNASTGSFTLHPTAAGTYNIEVGIYANGKLVGSKKIQVVIDQTTEETINNTLLTNPLSPNNAQPVVEDLMAKNPTKFAGRNTNSRDVGSNSTVGHVIGIHDDINALNNYKNTVMTHINNAIDAFIDYFVGLGVNETFVKTAAKALKEYYQSILDSVPILSNRDKLANTLVQGSSKYTDPSTGETKTANTAYILKIDLDWYTDEFAADMMDSSWEQNTSGIYIGAEGNTNANITDLDVWVDYRIVFLNFQKLLSGAGL